MKKVPTSSSITFSRSLSPGIPRLIEPREETIRLWYAQLYRVAMRMTGRHDDAAEHVQDTFAKAIEKWQQYDGKASRAAWLRRILVNGIIDAHRRKQRAPTESFDVWAIHRTYSTESQPEAKLSDAEEVQRLREAIARLPEDTRCALVTTVIDGYSYQEAAEILKVPIGTVGSRVFHARARLRAELAEPLGNKP